MNIPGVGAITEWGLGRRVLFVVGTLLLGAACLVVVGIVDPHLPPSEKTVSLDQQPKDVVWNGNGVLLRVEHRRVTTVSRRVDGQDQLLYTFEDAYDYSDHEYVANYAAHGDPAIRYTYGDQAMTILTETYGSVFRYGQDGWWSIVLGDPFDGAGNYTLERIDRSNTSLLGDVTYLDNEGAQVGRARSEPADSYDRVYRSVFVNNSVTWERFGETEETVTYHLDDADAYARVRPMYYADAVHDGSSIEVTVSKETGRIQSMTEHRIVTTGVEDGERRVHLVVETTFSDYGDVDVTRPESLAPPSILAYLEDALAY